MFDVETFIETVKERPALYNVSHKYYNRKDVRARMWDEIGQKMYPEWESLEFREKHYRVNRMQKKWKSLKDCFNRENRLQKTCDPKKFRKKYEFYDNLSFLLRNQKNPAPGMPLKELSIKLEPEIRQLKQNLSIRSATQIATQLEGSAAKRKEEIPRSLKPKLLKKVEGLEDGDRLFLLSFLGDLKRLPFATKYWVKMKFSEIMQQAAMSLDGCQEPGQDGTYDQEVGSSGNCYPAEYSEKDNSPNPSSPEIYELCQD